MKAWEAGHLEDSCELIELTGCVFICFLGGGGVKDEESEFRIGGWLKSTDGGKSG